MKHLAWLVCVVACGSDGGASSPDASGSDAPAVDAATVADGPADADPLLDQRRAAADTTAHTHADCVAIGDFYWEIGDATQRLGQGAIGTTYAATTRVPIASASKIVFGAYVVQRTNGALTEVQKRALTMRSGNIGLNPVRCSASPSVAACLGDGTANPNYEYDAAEVDRFYYNGAHDQVLAAATAADGGLDLGALSAAAFTTEITQTLGVPSGIEYGSPQPAGGANATAEGFGVFLRAILDGTLALHDHLGEDAVCTLPGATCPTASSSPSPYAWHYSYNHWVEDDPSGDGAFSSPGALGFYPWLSANKTLYGIIARQSAAGGGIDSVRCGAKLRRAWVTAQAQ